MEKPFETTLVETTMSASAYVLVEIAPSFDKKGILEKIKEIGGVKRADTVTGPYDIILFGEAEGIPALEKMFYDVRNVDGVSRMTTCFAYQD